MGTNPTAGLDHCHGAHPISIGVTLNVSDSSFIHSDFLLETDSAQALFHDHAEDLPIIDYHCHLPPAQVANDRRFENLTQIWLYGDHYKWRAMRAAGIEERCITGDASDWEKFEAWARTVPQTLRNPLYHWTHLELRRPFGIEDRLLAPDTAESIWKDCNEKLAQPDFSCRGIMKRMKVVVVCTTDDPIDSLEHHQAIAADPGFDIRVLPTWRPDKAMAVDALEVFNPWVDRLAEVSGVAISDIESFMEALKVRHDFFHSVGCRLSDHGIETFYADPYTAEEIDHIFTRAREEKELREGEIRKFKSAMLYEFGLMDHKKGWVQQFHYGALRNNNTRLFRKLGPDTGFDSMGDWPVAQPLAKFLDLLDQTDQLARTILYNNNPRDNELIATMIGNFQDGSVPGKIQFGSGWWHLDQLDGMTRQIEALSNMGLLGCFVGMLTDSRSFLSYTRHEYFRRLLCNILGSEMERGLLPADFDLVGGMVEDICYNNARRYFGFDL